MEYRRLGRSGLKVSALSFGSWVTFSFQLDDSKAETILHRAYDAGINVFDVGYSGYYYYAQENLSSFIRKVRDNVFLISKAPAELDSDIAPNQEVTTDQAKRAAKIWSERLDESDDLSSSERVYRR